MRSWYRIIAKAAEQRATVSILDEIGFWGITGKSFIDDLRAQAKDAKEIVVEINSPGGSVFDALAIYNALRMHGAKIHVKVLGIAASAASLVAMAGDTIEMPENTMMMVHNPWTIAWGNADELRDQADVLDKIASSLVATYVARTGKTEDEIKALLAEDTWMTAAEAVERGFADSVTEALKVAASFDLDRLPENVRALFEATKPEPKAAGPSRAERIASAAKAAGFEAHAAAWALNAAIDTDEQIAAVIAQAREITHLCALSDTETEASALISANKPMAEVFAHITNLRAERSGRNEIDTAPKLKSDGKDRLPGSAGVTVRGIWANRNKQRSI